MPIPTSLSHSPPLRQLQAPTAISSQGPCHGTACSSPSWHPLTASAPPKRAHAHSSHPTTSQRLIEASSQSTRLFLHHLPAPALLPALSHSFFPTRLPAAALAPSPCQSPFLQAQSHHCPPRKVWCSPCRAAQLCAGRLQAEVSLPSATSYRAAPACRPAPPAEAPKARCPGMEQVCAELEQQRGQQERRLCTSLLLTRCKGALLRLEICTASSLLPAFQLSLVLCLLPQLTRV